MIIGKYPELRLRRNRKMSWVRRLVQENTLSPSDFILPIFLIDGSNKKESYVEECFGIPIPTIAVSDYQKLYAEQIRKWVKGDYVCLGTDGFGRSDTREKLRSFFEIDAKHIVFNALKVLKMDKQAEKFAKDNNIKFNSKHYLKR